MSRIRPSREAGQAAVESALTLPLFVFIVLGTLQLFLLLQAKQMAQYAVFQATRVGSVLNGRCDAMTHAALLALTPTVRAFMGSSFPGSPGEKLGAAFRLIRDNEYSQFRGWSSSEAIVWIIRESPQAPTIAAQAQFDRPLSGGAPTRLELRMIYWAPLLVPFADWVFSRLALAHLGIRSYNAQNPLMIRQTANWGSATSRPLQGEIASEYARRVAMQHYVFPIQVTSTMRMMSPVIYSEFASPNCPGTPNSL